MIRIYICVRACLLDLYNLQHRCQLDVRTFLSVNVLYCVWVVVQLLGGQSFSYQVSGKVFKCCNFFFFLLFLKCSCFNCFLCSYFVVLAFGTSCFFVILVRLHDFMQLLRWFFVQLFSMWFLLLEQGFLINWLGFVIVYLTSIVLAKFSQGLYLCNYCSGS